MAVNPLTVGYELTCRKSVKPVRIMDANIAEVAILTQVRYLAMKDIVIINGMQIENYCYKESNQIFATQVGTRTPVPLKDMKPYIKLLSTTIGINRTVSYTLQIKICN